VTNHLDDAFRNYISDHPTNPVVLKENEMEEVYNEYNLNNYIVQPLITKCRNSEKGWSGESDTYTFPGSKYVQITESGTWKATMNGVIFRYHSSCMCIGGFRILFWGIHINDPFDFNDFRDWSENLVRNIIVAGVKNPNDLYGCGWKPFDFRGYISKFKVVKNNCCVK
jgi:hypothetical protein